MARRVVEGLAVTLAVLLAMAVVVLYVLLLLFLGSYADDPTDTALEDVVYIGSGFGACVVAALTVRQAVRLARGRGRLGVVAGWVVGTVFAVLLWYGALNAINNQCASTVRCFTPCDAASCDLPSDTAPVR